MTSNLNEDLMDTNLDLPEGEIKIEGAADPVYVDAINVHNKKKKEVEKILKDKKPELKKPFLGVKGNTTILPKTKEMKKLKLAEDMFRPVRESMADAPESYEGIFRVIDNMEHIINYINELEEEDMSYEDMQQSYNVLDDSMREFEDYLFEIKEAERRNGSLKEDTAVMDRKGWELQDKRNNKDVWSDIYNELVDMKSIEAPHRQIKNGNAQRYKGSWDFANSLRVGASRDGGIVVKADDLSELDFAKEVAETYGVEWRIKEHTSRYADAKYELFIYPYNQVVTESLTESVDNDSYSAVAKYFDYGAPSNFVEVITDLVDRALMNKDEDYDTEEAVHDAIDSGLIYHKDIWAVKAGYEDSTLNDETYERLFHDIYSIVSSLSDNDDVDESLKRTPKLIEGFYRGAKGVEFIGHGEWSDPELIYNGYSFNYWDIEDALWNDFLEETGYNDSQSNDPKVEAEFDRYVQDRVTDYLDDCIFGGAGTPIDESLNEAVCNYVDTYNGATIYECEGKYSADVSVWNGDKSNSKRVVADSVEELKRKIDNAGKDYKKQAEYTNESKSRRTRRVR